MLKKEYPPSPDEISEQARSYKTQLGEVIACMREINKNFQQHTEKAKWKYRNTCYACGKEGHWRRKCPTQPRGQPNQQKTQPVKKPVVTTGSAQTEAGGTSKATRASRKKKRLPLQPQYYNPDPMARMFGRANEAPVIVDGEETTCLVDTGATVSVISTDYCIKRGLTVYPLEAMVPIVGTAGGLIPYARHMEVTLRFPHIPGYEDEVPLLLIDDTSSDVDRVPIQVGTKVIAAVTEHIKPDSLHRLNEIWKQTYIGTLMACAIKGRKEPEDAFSMDSVKGPVKLRKSVELGPWEQTEV